MLMYSKEAFCQHQAKCLSYEMGCASSLSEKAMKSNESTKTERSIKAAILIQNWYRRYVARLEVRRRCTWNIFQSIEYSGEQDQVKLYNFFMELLSQMSPDIDGQPRILNSLNSAQKQFIYDSQTIEKEEKELSKQTDPSYIQIDPIYKGIHLTFPLTHVQLQDLIQSYKNKKRLHARYLIHLLHETRHLLKKRPNIMMASTSISNQITICGDLHGKLEDLYMVFSKNGLPSVDNPYIFNGDFVDRGANSVEVTVILFACLLTNPNEVYLNRGNHEDQVMNLRYGFSKEIMRKYRGFSNKIMRLFEDVFSWLPVATIIDDKILVVHGGIADTTDLDLVKKIDRHKYLSTLHPPKGLGSMTNLKDYVDNPDMKEWKQMLDLLWSDPKCQVGCIPNVYRGGGSYFGPDVTQRILQKYNLQMIIRSHECKIEGYEYTHNDKVLTLFSASNYYDFGSNRGAYAKLQGPNLECHIVQYQSSLQQGKKTSFTQRISALEVSAIDDLREKILGRKGKLMTEFCKYDTENTGKIKMNDWHFVMETVLEMDLPWRTLRPKLAICENDFVLYESTFEQKCIKHRYAENGPTLTEMLYRQRENLEVIFRLLDKDNS
ncbi:hypothetical protein ScPMuIL_010639, partial [Solemya velum]